MRNNSLDNTLMGSACTKSDVEGSIDDDQAVKEDINKDETNEFVDRVDAKKKEKGNIFQLSCANGQL